MDGSAICFLRVTQRSSMIYGLEAESNAKELMKPKSLTLAMLFAFVAHFYSVADLRAQLVQMSVRSLAQESHRAVSLPEKDRLALVSVVQITLGGIIVGRLAAYDDATTARPADYMEFYNTMGDLLAVSWFDRFGIERLAVDRALAERSDTLKGVLVLLDSGDSI